MEWERIFISRICCSSSLSSFLEMMILWKFIHACKIAWCTHYVIWVEGRNWWRIALINYTSSQKRFSIAVEKWRDIARWIYWVHIKRIMWIWQESWLQCMCMYTLYTYLKTSSSSLYNQKPYIHIDSCFEYGWCLVKIDEWKFM